MSATPRAITPASTTGEFHCDEFRRDVSYTNWRPHGTDDWLLIYTVGGAGRLSSSCGITLSRPGDVLLYSPHEAQDYSTAPEAGQWHLLWAHFIPQAHWQEWLRWPVGENGFKLLSIRDGEVRHEFHAAMSRMVALSKRPLPIAPELALLALEETLLWAKLAAFKDQWITMDGRVRKAIGYLTIHFREPFQLEKLAANCGLSVSRLAHLFKAETGISPQCFLEKHRMQTASRLLRLTGFTVSEVAVEVGYNDPFYFSNRFRRFTGKSPSQFRATKSVYQKAG